ncbi:CvpA family protein [Thalassobius sp. I31.1]|uniref:CvpA family protein n=1 Tax=Thalassobius sp. I31.1 TaxID=2109912 RepID=UPI000D198A6D|nr:CvpA family protein [Thalassobius sp. I31.1]
MEGFTVIDGIAAAVIILSALLAYSRGLVREVLSIGGWIAATILAYMFAASVQPLLAQVPGLNGFIEGQCELALLISFAVVMVIGLLLFSIFTPLFSGAVQRSFLGGLDQGLGFLFGAARGVLLVVIGLMAYDFINPGEPAPMVADSRTNAVFGHLTTQVEDQVPSDVPGWLQTRYNSFIASCEAPAG